VPTETQIRLDAIEPSPLNPRREFDQEALEELAASLGASGLIQPVVVRPIGPNRFSLLAGERRWRAAHLAGWETIPAVVREAASDSEALAVMLAENLQREDLTAIEQANAFERLQALGISQSEIARRTGKAQPTIANTLRLLQLPEPVQALVQSGKLAPASARALIPLAAFAPVCHAMAERVIVQEIPTRILERDALATREWELATAGVVRALDDRTPWDWRQRCREGCEFGAYRDASGARGGVCLRPDHYDELQREAEALPAPAVVTIAETSSFSPGDREAREALWRETRALLESAKTFADRRLVATLCVDVIAQTKRETLKALADAEGMPAPLLAELVRPDPTRIGIARALSGYNPAFVAKLALTCLLRTEAEESAHRGHPARFAEWLTGRGDADEEESPPQNAPLARICFGCQATLADKPEPGQWASTTRCLDCTLKGELAPPGSAAA
jgi:ParB/RepB/Spo0J family partition protein